MKRVAIGSLLGVALVLVVASPVYAISSPDSVSIVDRYVNRNLLEDGDQLYYFHYNLEYASIPDESVDEAFIFRLMDEDGDIELARNLAYPYSDSGYNHGVSAFYLDADEAPAWDAEYIIRISENPAVFNNPKDYDFALNSDDFTTQTGVTDNQQEVTDNVLDIAYDLEVQWNTDLTSAQDPGIVLNAAGEVYFRNAIYGIQSMAPGLFFYQALDINYTSRSWTNTQAETYRTRLEGTELGNQTQRVADMLHIDQQFLTSFGVLAIAALLMYLSDRKWNSTHPGLVASLVVATAGAVMGFGGMAYYAILGLFLVIYGGYFWFFQKA